MGNETLPPHLPTRYIGITAPDSAEQLDRLEEKLPFHPGSERRVFIGFLTNECTLAGQPCPVQTKQNLPFAQIAEMTSKPRKGMKYLVHHFTTNTANLVDQVEEVLEQTGPLIHGIQLNVTWPEPWAVKEIHERLRRRLRSQGIEPRVILQIGREALAEAEGPRHVGYMARGYFGAATDLLIDASGGEGKELNPEECIWNLAAIQREAPFHFNLVAAGGLSRHNVAFYLTTIRKGAGLTSLSCDAQGKLRHPHEDTFDVYEALNYFLEADTACR